VTLSRGKIHNENCQSSLKSSLGCEILTRLLINKNLPGVFFPITIFLQNRSEISIKLIKLLSFRGHIEKRYYFQSHSFHYSWVTASAENKNIFVSFHFANSIMEICIYWCLKYDDKMWFTCRTLTKWKLILISWNYTFCCWKICHEIYWFVSGF
jgi:hypothetical protein